MEQVRRGVREGETRKVAEEDRMGKDVEEGGGMGSGGVEGWVRLLEGVVGV